MNPRVKILIIAGSIILVILIVVTIIVGNLTKSDKAGQQSSLIPTGTFEETLPGERGDLSILEAAERFEREDALSEEEIQNIEELIANAPIDTPDFTIGYSPLLDDFFVSIKTPQGEERFRQYLADNNLSDLFRDFPDRFQIGSQPIETFIRDAEENFQREVVAVERKIQQQTASKQSQSDKEAVNPDLPSLSFSQFSGLMTSLFTQDTEKIKEAIEESNKEIEQGQKSNKDNSGRGNNGKGSKGSNLPDGKPYSGQGTPQLKRIMSVIKAIPGLRWGGICATSGHMSNSEHYQCNAVDVFGAEGLLDNTFTSLLAAAKKNQLPIHCLIYERFSYSREYNWAKHSYSGASTHDSHIHISGWPSVGGAC